LVSSFVVLYFKCVFLPSVHREFRHKIVSSILSKDIEYSEAQKMAFLHSRLTEDVATIPDLLSEFFQRRQSFSTFDRPPRSFAQPEDIINTAPLSAADVREPLRDDEMRRPTMEGFERRNAQLIIKSVQTSTLFDRRYFGAAEMECGGFKGRGVQSAKHMRGSEVFATKEFFDGRSSAERQRG
jgi:hypothetical protein